MKKSLKNDITITTTKEEFYQELKKNLLNPEQCIRLEDKIIKFEWMLKEYKIIEQEIKDLKLELARKDKIIESLMREIEILLTENKELKEILNIV
jgi:cell division septum initiation protein DivIVA